VIMFQLPFPNLKGIKKWGNFPLAAAMLKGMALQEGLAELFDMEILPGDLVNEAGDAWLVEYLERRRPDVICATLYLWNAQRSIHIARRLKKSLPELKFVVGGPEVSEDSRYILENAAVDYGCIGEGEEVFVAILRAIAGGAELPPIRGAFQRLEGRLSITAGRGWVQDLELLPSPLQTGAFRPRQEAIVPYETMRGCRCSCSYCITGTTPPRYFSAGRVAKDLALLHEHRVQVVHLICSNFLVHPEFFTICGALARINADRRMSLTCLTYGEDVTREKAEALEACNFSNVEIGLQSTNPKTLKIIRRPVFNEARFLQGLAHLRDAGFDPTVDLIAGLPGDALEDIKRSVDFLEKNQVRKYAVYPLRLLPGSPLRKSAAELGLQADPLPPYRVTGTGSLTQTQILSAATHNKLEGKEPFAKLAQEYRLPRGLARGVGKAASCQVEAPVAKLLVSRGTDLQRFAQQSAGKFCMQVILFFSSLRESLSAFDGIVAALCRANPFGQIKPVFEVGSAAELEEVLLLCQRISHRNVVQKNIVMTDPSCHGEKLRLPEDFSLYQQIEIGAVGDLEQVSACALDNLLIDLSTELDAPELGAVLAFLANSGRKIHYKNLAFHYLEHLARRRYRGEPGCILAPVGIGSIALLDEGGNVHPQLSTSDGLALEIGQMQLMFMREIAGAELRPAGSAASPAWASA
jgi:hypothetical protein